MIIRSGLIQNKREVDPGKFRKHWKEVHGPLAAKLPHLRGYVQNLVVERREDLRPSALHPVDGISQLWFEDVATMQTGMSSPQNDACVKDISGFLANVTLAVQHPGEWAGSGIGAPAVKVMALQVGGTTADAFGEHFSERLRSAGIGPVRWRLNPVLGNEFIVDPSIDRSVEKIVSVLEAWLGSEKEAASLLNQSFWGAAVELAPAMAATVTELVLIQPPESHSMSS